MILAEQLGSRMRAMVASSSSSHGLPPDLPIPKHFAKLKDSRRAYRPQHLLQGILVITLCAVIAGAQDWQEVENFGRKRHDWLKRFLRLPHGIPAHESFERVVDGPASQALHRVALFHRQREGECQGLWQWAAALLGNGE
jgi:hypothetical protein